MDNTKNIVLIGFMGAGKSVIAQALAQRLERAVVSTDEVIAQKEKRPITDIFRDSGEPYFRRVEKEVVAEVALQSGIVIDCGGGVVLDEGNTANLKMHGLLFYLSATPEEIYRRIQAQSHRPLLNLENPMMKIKELLAMRRSFYEQADYQIETDRKLPQQICEEIIALLL